MPSSERLKVFTWNVHGSYLCYLSSIPHDIFVPVRDGNGEGYGGRTTSFDWPDNVYEIPADDVCEEEFDLVLYQSHRNWLVDQHDILSEKQKRGPRIYLERNPPWQHPTDAKHPVRDNDVLMVHVTHFNALMWDSNGCRVRVIEHGVPAPARPAYEGDLDAGIVVVNDIVQRNRLCGNDVLETVRARIPLDLIGRHSEEAGGLGEVPPRELPAFRSRYRFLFNPTRYTSLGLAVCEAMAAGMPVIGLATTEMSTAVINGVTGWVETDIGALVGHMLRLLDDRDEAARLGRNARAYALGRFGMDRFVEAWDAVLHEAVAVRAAV